MEVGVLQRDREAVAIVADVPVVHAYGDDVSFHQSLEVEGLGLTERRRGEDRRAVVALEVEGSVVPKEEGIVVAVLRRETSLFDRDSSRPDAGQRAGAALPAERSRHRQPLGLGCHDLVRDPDGN
jgi:hypothetical protein